MSEQPVVSPNVISNIISLETNKNKQKNRTKQIKNPKTLTTVWKLIGLFIIGELRFVIKRVSYVNFYN